MLPVVQVDHNNILRSSKLGAVECADCGGTSCKKLTINPYHGSQPCTLCCTEVTRVFSVLTWSVMFLNSGYPDVQV